MKKRVSQTRRQQMSLELGRYSHRYQHQLDETQQEPSDQDDEVDETMKLSRSVGNGKRFVVNRVD